MKEFKKLIEELKKIDKTHDERAAQKPGVRLIKTYIEDELRGYEYNTQDVYNPDTEKMESKRIYSPKVQAIIHEKFNNNLSRIQELNFQHGFYDIFSGILQQKFDEYGIQPLPTPKIKELEEMKEQKELKELAPVEITPALMADMIHFVNTGHGLSPQLKQAFLDPTFYLRISPTIKAQKPHKWPLQIAVEKELPHVTQVLIAIGATKTGDDQSLQGREVIEALKEAARHESPKMLKLLLKQYPFTKEDKNQAFMLLYRQFSLQDYMPCLFS